MCLGCYAEFGFPKIVSPTTRRIAELSDKVYEFSCVGGNLHCELDDWNIDDDFFEGDFKPYNPAVPVAQLAVETECYAALKAASEDERASALALRDGYLMDDGTLTPDIDEAAWNAQVEEDSRDPGQ